MAVRSDFSVNFELSPRLVDITSTSEEISVQDSHDTLSGIQDSSEGGQFEFLVSSAGGEALGGGVSVGLTTVLNDAQYAFSSTSPLETGTVTTPSATSLIDSTATFSTNLVKRGDWIINFTDQSVTEILTVVSETEVTTRGLRNGSLNTFTSADAYKIWEVKSASMSGGNFTAVDSVLADINPFFPVFGRTFALTASSSATSTSQTALEVGLFQGHVSINNLTGVAGTGRNGDGFLIGTTNHPSSNVADAKVIADTHGIRNLIFQEPITITEDLSAGYTLSAHSPFILLTLDPSADVTNCDFNTVGIIGQVDGINKIDGCWVYAITDFNGICEHSTLKGDIVLNADAIIFDCISHTTLHYVIITTVAGAEIVMENHHGSVQIAGVVDGDHIIDGGGGRVTLNASCTGGDIHIRGAWFELIDNSGVGCTVLDQRSTLTVAEKALIASTNTAAAAVQVKTDQMVFTNANELDSNVKSVNDVEVIGTGASGDEWGPTP
jgi:hypothetical protein